MLSVSGISTSTPAHPTTVDEQDRRIRHRGELFQVQRVPLCGLAHVVHDGRGRPRPEQDLLRSLTPPGVERRKGGGERSGLPGRPVRTLLEQFGTRETEEHHGPVTCSMTASARCSSIGGSAQCTSSSTTTSGRSGSDDFEQASDRPGSVGRERRADPEDLGDAIAHGRSVGFGSQPLAQRRRDLVGVATRSSSGL